MPRTIIDIPDAQLREVDRLCQLLGISRAEAVRRGLQGFVQQNEAVKTDGFGLWVPAADAPPSTPKSTRSRPRRQR
jgi:metal-responsive CopG/Arc/MetJ family transcriptional regulator